MGHRPTRHAALPDAARRVARRGTWHLHRPLSAWFSCPFWETSFVLLAKLSFDDVSGETHCLPDTWQQQGFGEKRLAVVGDAHLSLHLQGLGAERRLAAAEGVHQEFVDSGLEEAVQAFASDAEAVCQVVGKPCGVCPEVEVFLFAVGIGDGGLATGVGESPLGQEGDVAHSGKEERYLHVLAAVVFGVEELWVLVHGPTYPVVAVEGCAEMDGWSFARHQYVFQQSLTVDRCPLSIDH